MTYTLRWLAGLSFALAVLALGDGPSPHVTSAQTPIADLFINKLKGSENPVGQTPIDYPLVYNLAVGSRTAPSTAVTVSDTLPANTTFVSAEQLTGPGSFTITSPAVGSGGTVTFTAASLPADRQAVLRIRTAIVPGTPAGTVISNTATISSAGSDSNPANNTSNVSTTVRAAVGAGTISMTSSTTNHTTTTPATRNATAADGTRTRVTAVFNGATVFNQTVDAAQGSVGELALEESAKAALRNAAGASALISGPVNQGTTREATNATSGPVNEFVADATAVTSTLSVGPDTILIGPDQSQTFFVPAGTSNFNTNVHTETFVSAVTTVTSGFVNVTTLQLTTTAVAAPSPAIPQVFQNPGVVAALMGGIGNGTRNPTPVSARPEGTSPQAPPAPMPMLRPPSTGNAGLAYLAD